MVANDNEISSVWVVESFSRTGKSGPWKFEWVQVYSFDPTSIYKNKQTWKYRISKRKIRESPPVELGKAN